MGNPLIQEAWRRFGPAIAQAERSAAVIGALLQSRFMEQRKFILDDARRKAAFCTRRAGKTEALAAYLIKAALERPDALCIFVARTRIRAKELTWKTVECLCAALGVETEENRTELSRTFANGSVIRWRGADDIDDLRKKRGDKAWLVVIDEAQDFESAALQDMVDNIFGPALTDLRGTICLTGTPGLSPAGYWYRVTTGAEPDWSVHKWSVLDNPHMAHMREDLPALKKQRGWADDNPTYRREWLGQWVSDADLLFYRFDPLRNLHDSQANGPGWSHVLGWDLGLRDDMAIVVWGFHNQLSGLFEAFSWKKAGALVDECARVIQDCKNQFNIVAMVADTGGGGAMFVEEMRKRHGHHFEAAKKTDKYHHVKLMNDDLELGNVRLRKGGLYAEEMAVLPVDKGHLENNPDKPPREHPAWANHCCDAGLYAWRRAYHYLHEPGNKPRPKPGSVEFYAQQEREILERLEREVEQQASAEWWERS